MCVCVKFGSHLRSRVSAREDYLGLTRRLQRVTPHTIAAYCDAFPEMGRFMDELRAWRPDGIEVFAHQVEAAAWMAVRERHWEMVDAVVAMGRGADGGTDYCDLGAVVAGAAGAVTAPERKAWQAAKQRSQETLTGAAGRLM